MQMSKFGALIVAAGAMLAGCSSTPVAPPPGKPAPVTAAAPTPAPATMSTGTAKPAPSSTVATVSLPRSESVV